MDQLSSTEENYLKAILKLSLQSEDLVGTNAISNRMDIAAASVTDMLRKLADKKLIHYEKYKGVALTEEGLKLANNLVRKHRLWETFLVDKLGFQWDEVHEIAEQLEHVKSEHLIHKLDDFLGNPKFDPHGDPIPDSRGEIMSRKRMILSEVLQEATVVVLGVKDSSSSFLQFLNKLNISLGTRMVVKELQSYDQSMKVALDSHQELMLSKQVCENLYVGFMST